MSTKHEISDFQKDVVERSKTIPVLVDFWADWCAPCRILGPVLERLAERNAGTWVLAKVDTERFQDIARTYGIRSIPNVKLFVDGKVANEFTGALPEEMVLQWLKKAIPPKKNPAVENARELLFTLKFTEATNILELLVAADTTNVSARVLLAKAILLLDPDRAASLVKNVEPGDDDYELADAISVITTFHHRVLKDDLPAGDVKEAYADAARELIKGNFDGSLERLIRVIKEDRYYDDDGARKAGIAVFKLLGEEHPITLGRRREFNSALFR
jgi:putative thioredoxin